jgi:hypothetical protein
MQDQIILLFKELIASNGWSLRGIRVALGGGSASRVSDLMAIYTLIMVLSACACTLAAKLCNFMLSSIIREGLNMRKLIGRIVALIRTAETRVYLLFNLAAIVIILGVRTVH